LSSFSFSTVCKVCFGVPTPVPRNAPTVKAAGAFSCSQGAEAAGAPFVTIPAACPGSAAANRQTHLVRRYGFPLGAAAGRTCQDRQHRHGSRPGSARPPIVTNGALCSWAVIKHRTGGRVFYRNIWFVVVTSAGKREKKE